jgi:hypothetical protein
MDPDELRRHRRRVFQVSASLVTVLATAWACTLGVIPAIIAILIAKHVLVAILLMGSGLDAPKASEVP